MPIIYITIFLSLYTIRMKKISILILLCCLITAKVFSQRTIRYQNPIRFSTAAGHYKDEVRDPCIIKEGNKYYLIHTMFPFTHSDSRDSLKQDYNSSPGIRMYVSEDLKNWEVAKAAGRDGWLIKSADLPDNSPFKNRFWAPEIHKIKNKFYLVFTASNWIKNSYNPTNNMDDLNAFIGVSDKITGPYKHITYIPGGACDLTIMEDKPSGKVYAYLPAMDIFVQEIDLSKIEQNKVSLIGEKKKIVTAKNDDLKVDWNYKYLEGPYAFTENGRYYLFYAGLRKDGSKITGFNDNDDYEYWSGLAYADSPMGPFTKAESGKAFFGGHISVFTGPDERHWLAYRGEKLKSTHGYLSIDPFDIDPKTGKARFFEPTNSPQEIKLKINK